MSIISNTNIAVDFFTLPKKSPNMKYIYFLTHMHSDHYFGLSSGWDHGPIYCSETTAIVMLLKFPNLKNVKILKLCDPTIIYLNESKSLSLFVEVTLFDANHCPGSVMILFKGYMGTIMHTGDMRFTDSMIKNYPLLYNLENKSEDYKQCSIHIDELIFDNTYCDPVFDFPNREDAFYKIKDIIDENISKRILIAVDSIGKEELMVRLSEHYKTKIVCNEDRYKLIKSIEFRPELFTLEKKEGWIEIIRKNEIDKRLNDVSEKCIVITATGWANSTVYTSGDKKKYIAPYSLHSNFNEIEKFVRSIMPCILKCVVRHHGSGEKINRITEFSSYMITLQHLKQRGYDFFLKNYTRPDSLSPEYKKLMNKENSIEIQKELNLFHDQGPAKILESSFQEFINPRKKDMSWKLKKAAKNTKKIDQMFSVKSNKK